MHQLYQNHLFKILIHRLSQSSVILSLNKTAFYQFIFFFRNTMASTILRCMLHLSAVLISLLELISCSTSNAVRYMQDELFMHKFSVGAVFVFLLLFFSHLMNLVGNGKLFSSLSSLQLVSIAFWVQLCPVLLQKKTS